MSTRRRRRRRFDPIPIADRLGRFRAGQGAPAGDGAIELQAAWPEVVGGPAAKHSVVVRRSRAGVVAVACSSAMWAQELDARRDLLAERLARAVPQVEVTAIRFVVGDHVMPADVTRTRRQAPEPTPEERTAAEEAMVDVTDPVLRELLERAAAGQMAIARAAAKFPAKRGRGTSG